MWQMTLIYIALTLMLSESDMWQNHKIWQRVTFCWILGTHVNPSLSAGMMDREREKYNFAKDDWNSSDCKIDKSDPPTILCSGFNFTLDKGTVRQCHPNRYHQIICPWQLVCHNNNSVSDTWLLSIHNTLHKVSHWIFPQPQYKYLSGRLQKVIKIPLSWHYLHPRLKL